MWFFLRQNDKLQLFFWITWIHLSSSDPSLKVRTGETMTNFYFLSCWRRKHHFIFTINCYCYASLPSSEWQIMAFLNKFLYLIPPPSDPSLKVRTGETMTNYFFCHVDEGNITSYLPLIAIVFVMLTKETSHYILAQTLSDFGVWFEAVYCLAISRKKNSVVADVCTDV